MFPETKMNRSKSRNLEKIWQIGLNLAPAWWAFVLSFLALGGSKPQMLDKRALN